MVGDDFLAEADHQLATTLLQDLHLGPGKAGPALTGKQMQGPTLELDGVVPGHLAGVLEAENPFQDVGGVQEAVCHLGLLGRHTELLVEPGQEFLQHGAGLVDGGGARQPEFTDQPVLEVASHAFDTALGLRGTSKYLFNA